MIDICRRLPSGCSRRDQMRTFGAICVVAGLLTTACDNSGPANTTAASTVNVPTVSDTFPGTLAVQGINTHNFNVAQIGPVTVTMTAVGPPATVSVGLAVGSVSAGVCGLSQTTAVLAQAGTTPQISGNVSAIGIYCVGIFDTGNLSAPASYSITVTHP
jgi:hypothetical protein